MCGMGDRRHLPAVVGGGIAELPGHQRVHGLVDGRREQERQEPDEPGREINLHATIGYSFEISS